MISSVLLSASAAWAQSAPANESTPGSAVIPKQATPPPKNETEQPADATQPTGDLVDPSLQPGDTPNLDDLSDLSLDDDLQSDLLLFEDIPVVVSASRQATSLRFSPVPVSVISAQDIHFSGLTNIPELLQFVPGVDVLQISRNQYAVGVHGLHDTFSDRTLTLIDGRDATSPVFGGTNFLRYPLFIEDIDRIEVVRGPGGAAFGANAFNGVINIIKKKPEDVLGVFTSFRLNDFGDVDTEARWAAKAGKLSWRLSVGYSAQESSDQAIGQSNFFSRDFSRGYKIDAEAVYHLSDSTDLNFGVGYSTIEQGDFEFLTVQPMRDGRLETTRAFAKLNHTFASGATGYLQWFGNFLRTNEPSIQLTGAFENDLEGQLNMKVGAKHHVTFGGNARGVHITNTQINPQDFLFPNAPINEISTGFFVVDKWKATDRLTIESQARGDYNTETGADWSGRLSALYALDAKQNHVIRISGAKAFRAPFAVLREVETSRVPLPPPAPPGLFALNLRPPQSLDNEETYSIEVGYDGTLADGLTLRGNAYYQRYTNVIGINTSVAGPVTTFQFANIDGADALGAEIELTLKRRLWSISGWYAYNDFGRDLPGQDVRAFLPAKNKAGASVRFQLPAAITLNANYRFTDTTRGGIGAAGVNVGSSNRFDLALSKRFLNDRAELQIGVQDLLSDTRSPIAGVGNFTSHQTPGRSFYIRLQFTF